MREFYGGDTHVPEKLVSIFEPTTEVIRKGKASKPNSLREIARKLSSPVAPSPETGLPVQNRKQRNAPGAPVPPMPVQIV